MQKIGVFTSGGDAPGMNACVRAVVRTAIYYGKEPYGIYRGYEGMIEGDINPLGVRSVSGIINQGGTILKSARSSRFMTEEGRKEAFEQLQKHGIEAVVAIGGDGTFKGAHALYEEYGIPIIGVPGTIDNDLAGCDYTLGYDTATNTVLHSIDAIRDTAQSHNRLFFIEVMGRNSGFIALRTAIAGGAEAAVIPEDEMTVEDLIGVLESGSHSNKTSSLVIVAEGKESGNSFELARKVRQSFSYYDTRVTVLGHVQRGGSPTCFDRILASRLGLLAVEAILEGKKDVMVGMIHRHVAYTPFEEAVRSRNEIDPELIRVSKILSI
ncbi:MAG: 6-phosphofructokinase [Bacteroidetes bacterium]|nr:6-phosphofructokinase [Bacteroidota bacterium]MCB9042526.1 6-phosphofructokinase [Chitinophagales bacterium]